MTVIEGLIANLDTGSDTKALRLGWDYWIPSSASTPNSDIKPSIKLTPYTDGYGIGRAIHPYVLDKRTLPDGAKPIFSEDMDARQIANGIWRRSLIQPGSYDCQGGDYEIGSIDAGCRLDDNLIALIGHKPSDLARWLIHIKEDDEYKEAYKLLLANKFKDCRRLFPKLEDVGWPSKPELDYLPPFYVAVLYAELGRAAVNQAGLLQISTDDGIELTTKAVLDRLKASHGRFNSLAIKRHLEHAPLQTIAFGLPDKIIIDQDKKAASAYTKQVMGKLFLKLSKDGTLHITPENPEDSRKIMDCFSVHPQFMKEERNGHGFSYKARKAGFFWGLTAHINPAVRLLEIALTAREWNKKYRPDGPKLPEANNYKKANPVARAIATIQYQWVYEHDRHLALKYLRSRAIKSENEDENGDDNVEENTEKKETKTLPGPTIETTTPHAIIDYLGDKSGLTLLESAIEYHATLPKMGRVGYTARSQAHLWLNDKGSDLYHYKKYQFEAIASYKRAISNELPSTPKDPSFTSRKNSEKFDQDFRPKGKIRNKNINQPVEFPISGDQKIAVLSQNESKAICFFSTDPMHAFAIREKISHYRVKKANEKKVKVET